jgi:hypothetical protein
MLILTAISNVGRTWDGVAVGGLRRAQEIDHIVDKMHSKYLYFSVVGGDLFLGFPNYNPLYIWFGGDASFGSQ